jgi:hypothetical protein
MAGFKTIFQTLTTDVTSTDVEGVGRLRWEDDKCYRWVKNDGAADIAANSLACHTFSNAATSLQNVAKPLTANLAYLAGVAISTISTTTGTYCYGWVQVFGLNASIAVTPVNTETTANPTTGFALIGVTGAAWAASGATAGAAPLYARHLKLLVSVAAGTTVSTGCACEVRCL